MNHTRLTFSCYEDHFDYHMRKKYIYIYIYLWLLFLKEKGKCDQAMDILKNTYIVLYL